jgi:hypothetical protein
MLSRNIHNNINKNFNIEMGRKNHFGREIFVENISEKLNVFKT